MLNAPPARVYRVGFQHSPPRQYVSADGKPYGPMIDVIREAANRAGVSLGSGVGATLRNSGAAAAAEVIRRVIGDMAEDGSLAAIHFRWYASPSSETLLLQYLGQVQQADRIKTAGVARDPPAGGEAPEGGDHRDDRRCARA